MNEQETIGTPMSDDELVSVCLEEASRGIGGGLDAENDSDITLPLDYFFGKRPLISKRAQQDPNSSRYVSLDVLDSVEATLAEIMPTFTTDEIGIYMPFGEDDEEQADLETALVNFLFFDQYDGWLLLQQALKDALLHRNCTVKAYWDERVTVTYETYDDVPMMAIGQILQPKQEDETVEIVHQLDENGEAVDEQDCEMDAMDEMAEMSMMGDHPMMGEQQTVSIKIKRTTLVGKPVIESVAPEEVIVCGDQLSPVLENARFVAHEKIETVSSLIEQGFDPEIVFTLPTYNSNIESLSRSRESEEFDYESAHDSTRLVRVFECYILVDYDGDGIAERRKVVISGNNLLSNDEWDSVPLIGGVATPVPHKYKGISLYDRIKDIQDTKTDLIRAVVDNTQLAATPRIGVVTGEANLDDLLTSRTGGIVRMDTPNSVFPLNTPDVPQSSYSLLTFMDAQRSERGGSAVGTANQAQAVSGDMLELSTPIPMHDGTFKLMGDIVDGDEIVASNGDKTTVTHAHEIKNPKRAYDLEFSNGAKIKAGGEHRWTVKVSNTSPNTTGSWHTVNTDKLVEYLRDSEGKKKSVRLPRVLRPRTSNTDVTIDPYCLGVWLGDGNSHSPRITSPDSAIMDRFVDAGYKYTIEPSSVKSKADVYAITDEKIRGANGMYADNGSFSSKLRGLDLLKRHGGEKHIPEEYFKADYYVKLELLRGLMDTDGYAKPSSATHEFTQSEGRLKDDFMRLIYSMGAVPRVHKVVTAEQHNLRMANSDCDIKPIARSNSYTIGFTLHDNPFYLERKASRYKPPTQSTTYKLDSAVEVDVVPMRCLSVDSGDRLYAVGKEFTLTHNSAHGIERVMSAMELSNAMIARTIGETLIRGIFVQMHSLIRQHHKGELTAKVGGSWLTSVPSEWKARPDVSIQIGTSQSERNRQSMAMQEIIGLQEKLFGMQSPMVNDKVAYKAIHDAIALAGIKSPENYIIDPESEEGMQAAQQQSEQQQQQQQEQQQLQQMMAQAQNKIAEAEAMKSQAAMANVRVKAENDSLKNEIERIKQLVNASDKADQNELDYAKLESANAIKLLEIEQEAKRELDMQYQTNLRSMNNG